MISDSQVLGILISYYFGQLMIIIESSRSWVFMFFLFFAAKQAAKHCWSPCFRTVIRIACGCQVSIVLIAWLIVSLSLLTEFLFRASNFPQLSQARVDPPGDERRVRKREKVSMRRGEKWGGEKGRGCWRNNRCVGPMNEFSTWVMYV